MVNTMVVMECCSFGGGDDGEYNVSGFVEISSKSRTQNAFLFGTESFGRVNFICYLVFSKPTLCTESQHK